MFNANLIKELKLKIQLFLGRKESSESTGIHDSGKGTKIHDNTTINYRTGIKEEGENADIRGNKIIKS